MKAARFAMSPQEVNQQAQDALNASIDYSPAGMGTIIGKSAKGWATAPGKFSNMLDKMERAEISDVGAKVNKQNIKGIIEDANNAIFSETPSTQLQYVFDHPELYKQYPELKTLPVEIKALESKTAAQLGVDNYGNPIIEINTSFLNNKKDTIKKTLLHEIQHAIQEKEGFARGGSPESAKAMAVEKFNKLSSEANAIMQYSDFKTNPELVKRLREIEDSQKSLFGEIDPVDAYKRLGGEIEARSVASRSNIPQEQLKYSQPYGGENIPLKEWIRAEDFLDK
jgi:hypothetical protein